MSRDFKKKKKSDAFVQPFIGSWRVQLHSETRWMCQYKSNIVQVFFFFFSLFVFWCELAPPQLHIALPCYIWTVVQVQLWWLHWSKPSKFAAYNARHQASATTTKKRQCKPASIYFFYRSNTKKWPALVPVLQAFLFSPSYCQALKSSLRFILACPFSPATLFLSFLRNILLGPFHLCHDLYRG